MLIAHFSGRLLATFDVAFLRELLRFGAPYTPGLPRVHFASELT
jgi:hypothetical protein